MRDTVTISTALKNVSDNLRDLRSDTRLNEAIIELVKSLATDFAHFEKYSEAILAKASSDFNPFWPFPASVLHY